ncbi:hypothetical protein AGLY_010522 [Aphis glycines]|uniref:Uncharacterized protein n=1 Tax=Aphis glycines TaxID=307491 RepID=A0A6G0TDT5_APHGL|nr:hypothetical protein AGLY_010522 [Aphis glycines]
MKVTRSNKDGLKAIFERHMYTVKYIGILQSELDYSEPHVITTHLMTCTKDTGKINASKCVNKVLQLAKDNEKNPGQIFSEVVSILLKNKTKSSDEEMLQIIINKCAERNLFPDPQIINVDFEKSVINAIKIVIGEDVQIQGCFFHLCQSLEQLYRSNEEFSHFCGMLDNLEFLLINDINTGNVIPEEATYLMEYFELAYIGSDIRIKENVRDATLNKRDRTNNVNHKHPTIWTLITKMRHENAADETKVAQRQLSTIGPPSKKKRCIKTSLRRIQ